MRMISIVAFGLLAACADSTTYLKNEKSGEVVQCGGVHSITIVESAVQAREAQCIQDYKERGFVRVPSNK